MAKEDAPYIIDPRQYKKELEERVAFYVAKINPLPINKKKYKRVLRPPSFKSSYQESLWQQEEIRRIVEGHDGLVGSMYFYYNYAFIQKITGGKIRPDFRVADHEWYIRCERAVNTVGRGMIAVKRRRYGASWKMAASVIRSMIINGHYTIGINSKTEVDSKELFRKVRFILDSLPSFLRPKLGSQQTLKVEFYRERRDEFGNTIKHGHQNTMVAKAPTVSAFEGYMLNEWWSDEAGKTKDILQLFSFTEDTMMDEYQRTGTPFIFGTVGEIDKAGAGIMELWQNAEAYGLEKFFIGGWMGLFVDEFGNDQIEESIRYIIYEGESKKKRGNKFYIDFMQKYPLSEEHAFSISTEGGLGDVAAINAQRQRIIDEPPKMREGYFRWGVPEDGEEAVVFVPRPNGDIKLFESPEDLVDGYVTGCDPAHQIDNPIAGTSDMSLIIRRRRIGLRPPKIALAYTARPKVGTEYFEQTIMALLFFNGTKVLVEKNVRDMLNYFVQAGYQSLLFHEPQVGTKMRITQGNSFGGRMTEPMRRYMERLIERDLKDNLEGIEYKLLLEQLPMYGIKNVDTVYAYGWALIMEQEMLKPAVRGDDSGKAKGLGFRYVKKNGKIVREQVNDSAFDLQQAASSHIPEGTIMSVAQLEQLSKKK